MLISHNAPYLPPKILHKHCFQLLLGRLKYLGEVKNKGYAKFGGGRGGGKQGALWEICKWRMADCGSRGSYPGARDVRGKHSFFVQLSLW